MSRDATARRARTCPATASYKVQFQKRLRRRPQRQQEPNVGRVPRVTRQLALAHKIDGLIRSGEIQNWAEAARLIGVTRARMTQIANLLLLAPQIQEDILRLPHVHSGHEPIIEHDLRGILAHVRWDEQITAGTGPPLGEAQ